MSHPTAVAIDHTAYPHIIDDIIHHASLEALTRLHATSREYRGRLIHKVTRHAVLMSARVGQVRHEHRMALYVPRSLHLHDRRNIPLLRTAADIRVLDLHPLSGRMTPNRCAAFTSLCTLRRFGAQVVWDTYYHFPWTLSTVVDYAVLNPRTLSYPFFGRHRFAPANSVTRYILHVWWRDYEVTAPGWPSNDVTMPILDELVLVFWFDTSSTFLPCSEEEATLVKFIQSYQRRSLGAAPWARRTIVVGMERKESYDTGLFPIAPGIAMHAPDPTPGMGWIEYWTFERWWAHLGAEKELIGVWPEEYAHLVSGWHTSSTYPQAH